MTLITVAIDIALVAAGIAVASKLLQNRLIDKEKQKASQKSMKEKQAKIKELMKNTDEKSKGEMERLQTEMMREMNETMQGSMKYMMFSLPLFFGVWFVLGYFYGAMIVETPFLVPKFSGFFMFNPFTWMPVDWTMQSGWLKWYFISYLLISIVLGIILKIREIALKKK